MKGSSKDQQKLILTDNGWSLLARTQLIRRNFDRVHVRSQDYHTPLTNTFTAAHAALYDPSSRVNKEFPRDIVHGIQLLGITTNIFQLHPSCSNPKMFMAYKTLFREIKCNIRFKDCNI
ncbi:hypothetical protein OSB04_015231 [Centaurea solstitialis]|uniref:Uncharacterized protein n=1 Tax=Centaurea solstitialis TaxID=347529 RepID=A0AA38T9S7_9ASTR|nr:hypothetical protein OSB04_015231 [Centaurea solstitialis]